MFTLNVFNHLSIARDSIRKTLSRLMRHGEGMFVGFESVVCSDQW